MKCQELKVYKNYINDHPGLTFSYFTAKPDLVNFAYCDYQVSVYRTIVPLLYDDN